MTNNFPAFGEKQKSNLEYVSYTTFSSIALLLDVPIRAVVH